MSRLHDLAEVIASGDASPLLDGQLFRSIRGIQTKIDLVTNKAAMASLTTLIRQNSHSNPALKAIAQAAANTDGQAAAIRSELVCRTISEVPGLLAAVVARMKDDVDAVRLVNNLAANSDLSAVSFIRVEGSVEALKVACTKYKLHAFGVINHLSRCPEAASALVNDGFVAQVLLPSLDDSEFNISVEQEATMARGTLALANLSGSEVRGHMPENPIVLGTIVKVLDHAARGVRLASITWLPPAVLFGLRNMTSDENVSKILVDCGLAHVLAGILKGWSRNGSGDSTLELCCDVVHNMARHPSIVQDLWDGGIILALQSLTDVERDLPGKTVDRSRVLIDMLMQRHCAVLMGLQRRLGDASPLYVLDDMVASIIVNLAFGPEAGTGVCPRPGQASCSGFLDRSG